ncbi:unnamed protein product [Rhodiola kirilowii]
MVLHVPQKIQNIWNEWNLRSAILTSLAFQVILIFAASWRKRTGNLIIIALIWSAYLLADWFAAFAVGLITNGLTECEKVAQTNDILSFWAPFLLLHLGGPDNITAFALEDNELWIRHLLGLVIQVLAVAYVLSQTLPNELTIPTILMLISGTIKYSERTRALYKACLSNFKNSMLPKPDPGPNYAQLMKELSGKQSAGVPVEIKTPDASNFPGKQHAEDPAVSQNAIKPGVSDSTISPGNLTELDDTEIVQYGHKFFQTFKGLIVDLMLSFKERNESRKFFLKRTVKEVFGVMEVELNLMYDVLYTKIGIVNNLMGYLLRLISSGCIISSLVLYHLHVIDVHNKQAQTGAAPPPQPQITKEFDNCVSYTLIAGALALDAIALFKIIFSDWTVMQLQNATARSLVSTVQKYLTLDRYWRWSKRIQNHNLIAYCLQRRNRLVEQAADCIGAQEILDELLFATSVPFDDELRDFVFSELKAKAEKGEDIDKAKEIFNGRGDWVLSEAGLPELLRSVDVEYDESLLLWHIATELCEQCDEDNHRVISHQATDVEAPSSTAQGAADVISKYRRFCKVLSEYMLYLLVMKPIMMSAVAGIGQIRYRDTCEELKRFVKGDHKEQMDLKVSFGEACERLVQINTKVEPSYVKGDKSKSVLFDACILAKKLKELKREKRWKIMSQVWVEIMAYAASHCRANTHAQEISKGGQLLSFVWLLMAHFGLGEQFRIKAGPARAKLIVAK